MKIADRVEMLEIDGNDRLINPVFIWDDHNRILIDAGFPGQVQLFSDAIGSAGFDIKDLTHIIITHQDIDHTGSVLDILKIAPNAKVLSHEKEVPYLQGELPPVKTAALKQTFANMPEKKRAYFERFEAAIKNTKFKIDESLTDGQLFPFGELGIEIVHTPGHTLGHICLYIKESKLLIAGDAIIIEDGNLKVPILTADIPMATMSLKKLLPYDIEQVVYYHGGLRRGDINQEIGKITISSR
ncbi:MULTISPECIES: MBL fold metallo-hydrolase [Dehalobacter]|uniref:MBL fold metallo-hydrolase n=1 Tax=Dehalobacter restrictus TaxID=55583 RepID=A0A857DGS1_9FIRM|nr:MULTISPECIES: MBL fold metallo-hydrolase [Dehalobacter]MCG1025858.1 MBL fold metallo-hydrolase [Dehalobacter sp.]OCZ50946.1 hypothetical protein A7D23_13645 [Dehalobacter sp. TeCB1]QGZ99910.1 MBL fold metallo-hydrolase [Dehalobacter restrictus]